MSLFRTDIENLEPYKLPGQAKYNLGDNENRLINWSFLLQEALEAVTAGELSFYGDNRYAELIETYATYLGVQPQQLTVGVGSDFIIHMLISGVLKVDEVFLTIDPDFFMYEVYNQLHGSRFKQYELPSDGETLRLKADDILAYANLVGAKMIMFSNPNNPSSVAFDENEVEELIRNFDGLVVIDEAYIEFSDTTSFVNQINQYKNLIVLRTLSKAFGLAGIRLGFAVADEQLIFELDRVIPPYSLPNLTAKIGTMAL
ncbi:TPA: aminotransferase class I/II-fold pyridoxal phosphate-dependent enzyme [Streptococcus suis]